MAQIQTLTLCRTRPEADLASGSSELDPAPQEGVVLLQKPNPKVAPTSLAAAGSKSGASLRRANGGTNANGNANGGTKVTNGEKYTVIF